jgi:hypothetical protein
MWWGSKVWGVIVFFDGPEPPEGLYDELLNLSNSSASHFNESFVDYISSIFPPTNEQ